jgi:hypothetical protein
MDTGGHTVWNHRKLLVLSFGVLALAASLIALGVALSMPHRIVAMSIYPEGSFNAELVKRYGRFLLVTGRTQDGAIASCSRKPGSLAGSKIKDEHRTDPAGLSTEHDSPEIGLTGYTVLPTRLDWF